MTADEAAGSGAIYYCVSTDDRTTWKVAKGTYGERSIVRNNSGTWQYNSNATYGYTTWANATTNAELAAIQEAMIVDAYMEHHAVVVLLSMDACRWFDGWHRRGCGADQRRPGGRCVQRR